MFTQLPIRLPIEIATIPLCIHVGQLQQPFAAHHTLGYIVLHCNFRLCMTNIGRRRKPSLRSGKRLKEVSPESPFIAFAQHRKSRTERTHTPCHLRRQQICRKRLLSHAIPIRIPRLPTQFFSLLFNRSRRRRLYLLLSNRHHLYWSGFPATPKQCQPCATGQARYLPPHRTHHSNAEMQSAPA